MVVTKAAVATKVVAHQVVARMALAKEAVGAVVDSKQFRVTSASWTGMTS